MLEADVTNTLRSELIKNRFFIKKYADASTQGLPDTIICKGKRAFFAEIKFIELENYPHEFKRWSILKTNSKMIQFTTMVQFDYHFLARYILIFRIAGKDIYYTLIMPSVLLEHMQKDVPMKLPKLYLLYDFVPY